MNYNEIRELAEWLEKSSFTAFSLSINGVHISVSKQQTQVPLLSQPELLPEAFYTPSPQAQEAQVSATNIATSAKSHIISSPIVGVYYESANPEKPAFVQVGQSVKKGDTLCILEAMKVMNTIVADVNGTVTEIFASNGSMVEACTPLFRIEIE